MGVTVLLAKGIMIGLLASIPLGPIGVICIQRTINKGKLSGFLSGVGAATADTIFATIAGFSLTFIINFIEEKQLILEIFGGIIVVLLGIMTFYTNPVRQLKRHKRKGSKLVEDYMSVLLLTITNPFAIFVFVALFASLGLGYDGKNLFFSFITLAGVFLGASIWWYTLSTIVNKFRDRFRLKQLWWVNKIAGAVIFILGVLAIIKVIKTLFFS